MIILDLGLPGLDGVEVCRQIRTFSDCYLIMLTARTDEVDVLIGLSVGADDYVTKPFSARELVARVGGRPVELTPIEFDLLSVLSSRPRLALSRHQLLETIWGEAEAADEHVVDVHVANLRRKLGDDPARQRFVVTVRGFGYRMGAG